MIKKKKKNNNNNNNKQSFVQNNDNSPLCSGVVDAVATVFAVNEIDPYFWPIDVGRLLSY